MRYGRLVALVLVLSLPAMACRKAPGKGPAAAGGRSGAPVKIGVAIDSGTPEDEARKALVLAGLREVASTFSGRIADDPDRTDHGDRVELRLVESRIRGEDREQLLRVLAEEGCALVCGVGEGYGAAIGKVARDHPSLHFAAVDPGPADLTGMPSNVRLVSFAEAEGSFLAGSLAGLAVLDKPGAKVGFIGGIDDAATHGNEAGFLAGAASANASLRKPGMVLVQYCGRDARALEAPGTAAAIAETMYGSGAEIIYHDAGASSAGLFATAGALGKLAIGADVDQGYLLSRRGADEASREAAFAIVTSMQKRVDRAIFLISKEFLETGTAKGGSLVLALADGGVDLAVNDANEAKMAPYAASLEAIRERIASGEIKAPQDATQAAQFLKDLR